MQLQVRLGVESGGAEGRADELLQESTRVVEHRQGRTQVVGVHQQATRAGVQRQQVALGAGGSYVKRSF